MAATEPATPHFEARAVAYSYRYCPSCRREWPARHSSCPDCVRWLGDHPLERTEWQLAPSRGEVCASAGADYELIAAVAVMLRAVSSDVAEDEIAAVASELHVAFRDREGWSVCPVPGQGWLAWTREGLRHAFLQGLEIERRLKAMLQRLERTSNGTGRFRWGLWLDQYVVPCGRDGSPALPERTAEAIFGFEPDDLFLCSDALYEANRHWEHFVCVPRRLLNGGEHHGYRLLDHKRPSALDHAEAIEIGPFIGRADALAFLTDCEQRSRTAHWRAAVIADAGSGKTRLVREWRRRHPDCRMLVANFSLFGGDLPGFAGQLATLPANRITAKSLLGSVLARIEAEAIGVLVLDDLHWADAESAAFLKHLLDRLSARPILALLVARPSGRAVTASLHPAVELTLPPLPSPDAQELARRLIADPRVAELAARRSKGNPLFIEQFAAWAAETAYQGAGDAPSNLHQTIAARIAHLSKDRLPAIRRRLQWGSSFERRAIHQELAQLEGEIGLWLDRLETGDYGDRIEASRHLVDLERVDFEIFIASTLAGRPRGRSSRLREAIDRLAAGSADQILADLKSRAADARGAEKANILREAERAGDAVARRYRWRLAAELYELALGMAEAHQCQGLSRRLGECRRRQAGAPVEPPSPERTLELKERPAVDALRLPEVWACLGLRYGSAAYLRRAAQAAEAIDDEPLAEWARQKRTEGGSS